MWEKLKKRGSLTRRLRVHDNVKNAKKLKLFNCPLYGRQFVWKCSLNRHLKAHQVDKPFSCDTPGETFKISEKLTKHLKIHKGNEIFLCDICGKRFVEKPHLDKHLKLHQDKKLFSFKACGKGFTSGRNPSVRLKIVQLIQECKLILRRNLFLLMNVESGTVLRQVQHSAAVADPFFVRYAEFFSGKNVG